MMSASEEQRVENSSVGFCRNTKDTHKGSCTSSLLNIRPHTHTHKYTLEQSPDHPYFTCSSHFPGFLAVGQMFWTMAREQK